ncbi:alpha-L-fucosidase [Nonomuraea sp. NPDC050404]|uniref:alpha-L-fucosidase n=1 Tax=Nonomuraea sp. NPDC050404 TaxID=3155783 RepID=UPI0033C044D5
MLSVDWTVLRRPVPDWYRDAKLGIFVHWGPYSVPAWAEPTGELGAVDDEVWFRHNPYAEWYWNTIRVENSPAREHHKEVWGDAPYDHFLDVWRTDAFDPADWCALFARAGARYVVPTSKHHDGVALWDAPGTGDRNTVRRGPRRDLIGEIAGATREAGMRFGVYYSGGLDWSVSDLPPLTRHEETRRYRPNDAAYAAYAYLHVRDLVDRFRPDVLWNDIEWPDAGKHGGSLGLLELLRHYYDTVPHGVVNDRWGETHRDYETSEYQFHLDSESASAWENCRGIGLSFGYNRAEGPEHLLTGRALVRHFVDVVSRGGNLLLNVGPKADGSIPAGQRRTLEHLGDWMAVNGRAIHDTRPLSASVAQPAQDPYVRWTRSGDTAWALAPAGGTVLLSCDPARLDAAAAALPDGRAVAAREVAGGIEADLPGAPATGPDAPDLLAVGFPIL